MNTQEQKFLSKIVAEPGIAAAELPRAQRGETLKSLELSGFIHYGPGGWYPTDRGTAAIAELS